MKKWHSLLLEEIANQYQVPVLSLSTPLVHSSFRVKNKSFLVYMTNNYTSQISCIASLINNFGWKKVIAVYEDVGYGTTISSMLDVFSQALQEFGLEIEYRLALPSSAFEPNPNDMITEELIKVKYMLDLFS